MPTNRWLNALRSWRYILRERYLKLFAAPVPPAPCPWPLTAADTRGLVLRWPTAYPWGGGEADIWIRPILNALRRRVAVEFAPIPQPHSGALVTQLVQGARSHNLIIDFADNPDLFHPDLASDSLLYFKMQYRREGYGDARVIPGGYINASEDYYHYVPWLRSVKDRRAPLYDVYGRFGPQFAQSTRRRAVELLKGQDRFRYEGSLGIVRYSRSLEEVARAKICIDLPGNGPFCYRLIDYFGIGACVIAPRHRAVLHVPLEDRKHIVYARADLSDLLDLCQYYLEHEPEREQIAQSSREFFDRYLHRAQLAAYYVTKALERLRELP
jgi:hypothetical protein